MAEQAARANDYAAAETYCKSYLATHASDKKGLRLLAFIYSLSGRYTEAIDSVSRAIAATGDAHEPSDYFSRGRWRLEYKDFSGAIADFSMVIDLCNHYKDGYYSESAFLHRAIAFTQSGLKNEAKADLSQISDECQTFALGQLFSRAVLREILGRS